MIQKKFDDINKDDIDFLISNKIRELKTLEYKRELSGSSDGDKKEFLADISSFANTSGGDIIYGIQGAVDETGKKTGEPDVVTPIKGMTADEVKLQIESMVRTGIAPRMKIHVKEISGYGQDGKGFVIFVRIPQSFASPHMVAFKGTSRFYCRNSAGKYQLDVQEIRNTFLATDSQAERIRSFLQDRLAKIMADETPVSLSTPYRLVLHILPVSSFLNRQRLPLCSNNDLVSTLKPIGASGWSHRYNLDGLLTYNRDYENETLNNAYCQIFFDGTMESVYADILRVGVGRKPKIGEPAYIASVAYEKYIIEAMRNYFKCYQILEVEPPIIVSMALLGCKGAYMYVSEHFGGTYQPIDRNVAILPEVQAENFDGNIPVLMKPIFDAVWNACGHPHSYNYDEKDN